MPKCKQRVIGGGEGNEDQGVEVVYILFEVDNTGSDVIG